MVMTPRPLADALVAALEIPSLAGALRRTVDLLKSPGADCASAGVRRHDTENLSADERLTCETSFPARRKDGPVLAGGDSRGSVRPFGAPPLRAGARARRIGLSRLARDVGPPPARRRVLSSRWSARRTTR